MNKPLTNEEPYSREDLDRLIDYLVNFPPRQEDGFLQYQINGQYVSPSVVEQAYNERLEQMLAQEAPHA